MPGWGWGIVVARVVEDGFKGTSICAVPGSGTVPREISRSVIRGWKTPR